MTRKMAALWRSRRGGLSALAVPALAAVVLAGCGGGAPAHTVAALAGRPAASAGGSQALKEAQGDQDMVNFARCMRLHGVQMSDPFHRPGHSGLSIDMPTQDAATAPAYHACNHYIQPIIAAKEQGATPVPAGVMVSLTSYARCMRAHDIPMLDPDPQGALSLGHVPGITGDFGRYSPQFRSADAACRHVLPRSVPDDGTGPK